MMITENRILIQFIKSHSQKQYNQIDPNLSWRAIVSSCSQREKQWSGRDTTQRGIVIDFHDSHFENHLNQLIEVSHEEKSNEVFFPLTKH
jgi:hypothetical protein